MDAFGVDGFPEGRLRSAVRLGGDFDVVMSKALDQFF
jgi:hypothetical protein